MLREPELGDHEEAEHEAEDLPRVLVEQVVYRQLGHIPGDLDEREDEEGDRNRDDCVDEREETIEVTLTLNRTLALRRHPRTVLGSGMRRTRDWRGHVRVRVHR